MIHADTCFARLLTRLRDARRGGGLLVGFLLLFVSDSDASSFSTAVAVMLRLKCMRRHGGRTVGTQPRWIRTETINPKSIRTQQPFAHSKKTFRLPNHHPRPAPRSALSATRSWSSHRINHNATWRFRCAHRASSTFTPRPAHKSASAPLRPPTFPLSRTPRFPRVPENRSGNATTRTIGRLKHASTPWRRLWIACRSTANADEYQRASRPSCTLCRRCCSSRAPTKLGSFGARPESGARGYPPPLPLETPSARSSRSSQAREGETWGEAPLGMTIIGNGNIAHENGCTQLWVWARLVSAPTPSSPAHDTAKKHLSASALPPMPRSRGRCACRPPSTASGHTRWDVQYLVSLPFPRAAKWVVVAVERGGRGEGG
ncbi:hypothetical protein DFH08DRAFT_488427 [Mycena albidolilacea]|uniref:Uncharacterized protein n=1 Tax=Mycena albidolilacea TaxID=1033008 RepID=A0AAD6Z6K7_9AGAR|nr:hypothetical protein DFH08DRAFT_488427 [Mycena albidolilacea]